MVTLLTCRVLSFSRTWIIVINFCSVYSLEFINRWHDAILGFLVLMSSAGNHVWPNKKWSSKWQGRGGSVIYITPICQVFNTKCIFDLSVIYNQFQSFYNSLLLATQLCTATLNAKSDSYALSGGRIHKQSWTWAHVLGEQITLNSSFLKC